MGYESIPLMKTADKAWQLQHSECVVAESHLRPTQQLPDRQCLTLTVFSGDRLVIRLSLA